MRAGTLCASPTSLPTPSTTVCVVHMPSPQREAVRRVRKHNKENCTVQKQCSVTVLKVESMKRCRPDSEVTFIHQQVITPGSLKDKRPSRR